MLMSKNDVPQIQKEFVNYINVSCRSLAINNTLEGVMEKGHTIPEYRTGESFIVNFRYNLISNHQKLFILVFQILKKYPILFWISL